MKTYSLHRTRPRQRRLGNHGNERSKQNIKKIKETFFSFKKKRVICKNEIFSGKQQFTYLRMTVQTK